MGDAVDSLAFVKLSFHLGKLLGQWLAADLIDQPDVLPVFDDVDELGN